MSKVLTFSRFYPAYHPKAGQPTYFVEKVLNGIPDTDLKFIVDSLPIGVKFSLDTTIDSIKHHTIRAGSRWKVGDKFSPRVWSGKPYRSKQITIAPDIEVKKVYSLCKDLLSKDFYLDGMRTHPDGLLEITKNDGLELADLLLWFKYPKPFSGQIICWNSEINY